jgi:uncharacterized surface protein with fasciclin (FAS1) repeats
MQFISPGEHFLEFIMKRVFINWIAGLGAATLLAACGGGGGSGNPSATTTQPPTTSSDSIAQTAAKTSDLSTLMSAVQYVDNSSLEKLMPALSDPGNLTMFAPTNAAFNKLAVELLGPGKEGKDLLSEDLKDDVRDIIKHHMVQSRVTRDSMASGQSIRTLLESGNFSIVVANGIVTITDGQGRTSTIKLADVLANNGVLHLVDNIILPPKAMLKKKSIVEIAVKTPALSSLVAALQFASNDGDLVTLLSNTGTFTVFAPTNAAFDALAVELLGAGKTAADLLVPANKDLVRAVLQYHVLGSVVKKSAIPLGKPIDPVLAGSDIFKIDKVQVMANGKDHDDDMNALIITDGRNRKAEIIATNIKANNGIVHVIDKVILPADKDIVQTAIASAPEFSILVEAVVAAGLVDALKAPGPLTVFAPTNAAFAALLTELHLTKAALLADTALLTRVLTYHVVPGLVLKADVPVGVPITTLQGGSFKVDANFKITDQSARTSNIVATDVLAKNGVIHVIDRVILPALH